jgi:hypothetical protein
VQLLEILPATYQRHDSSITTRTTIPKVFDKTLFIAGDKTLSIIAKKCLPLDNLFFVVKVPESFCTSSHYIMEFLNELKNRFSLEKVNNILIVDLLYCRRGRK